MTKLNTRSEILDALTACIANGAVYNVDFQEWKSKATRLLENDLRGVADTLYYAQGAERTQGDEDLHWSMISPSIITFPSKKTLALLDAAETEYSGGVRRVVNDWQPVAEAFRQVKPLIVKGRKPSDTPRVTPERTLDNTGTCGCCGQNVKMQGGKLVMHGFTIRYGFQEGKCPGVGFEPIEVSPAILHHMVKLIDITLNVLTGQMEHHTEGQYPVPHPTRRPTPKDDAQVHPDEQGYDRARRIFLANLESQIGYAQRDRADYEKRIAAWEPRPLPGEKGAA